MSISARPQVVAALLVTLGVAITAVMMIYGSNADTNAPTATPTRVPEEIQLLRVLDPVQINGALSSPEFSVVPVAVFVATRLSDHEPVDPARAETVIRLALQAANAILLPCRLTLRAEVAQVLRLPDHLGRLEANLPSSYGGHPPAGIVDPRLFNYQQGERLTAEAEELLSYAKRFTEPNTIAIFTVGSIVFYADQQLAAAGGVSFPPNVFHHPDDFPQRNAVVIAPDYRLGEALPTAIGPVTVAHELGHMLLNTGLHTDDPANLMGEVGGLELTAEQCLTMQATASELYGSELVPDPGPPGAVVEAAR